jgi:hypothetical protein
VVIWVTSVIAVASIIQGLNNVVRIGSPLWNQGFLRLPDSSIYVRPAAGTDRTASSSILEDAIAIREQCPSVEDATPFKQRAVFTGQAKSRALRQRTGGKLCCAVPSRNTFSVLPIFSMRDGRFINDFDNEHSAKVCAIGSGIADVVPARPCQQGNQLERTNVPRHRSF